MSPRGSPQIARRCCSNWLVIAPSMVQWPELWTAVPARWRAALRRPRTARGQDADVPEVVHDVDHEACRGVLQQRRQAERGRSSPAGCPQRGGSRRRGRRRHPQPGRAATTDSSRSKATTSSATAGAASSWRGLDGDSVRPTAEPQLAPAVEAAGATLQDRPRGEPVLEPGRIGPRAVEMPSSASRCFSTSRS